LKRVLALCFSLAAIVGLADMPGSAAAPAGAASVRLTAISSRVHPAGASLVIEATEPVPYLTSRPDPLTVTLDFRNVDAAGLANSVAPREGSPIRAVQVESAEADGAPVARVRVSLIEPVQHQVRSERSNVVVDFERPSARMTPYAVPAGSGRSVPVEPLPDAMQALVPEPPSGPSPIDLLRASTAQAPAAGAAVQQPAAPAEPGQTTASTGRQYSGHPISMDFQDMDLRAVLRLFADISGLNMVIDPAVQGSVNVKLDEVPWDQALDIILRANKLGYIVDGTIVRIAPLSVLADEEKQRSDLQKAQAEAGELTTVTRQLSYAQGADIVTLLRQANVISPRGQAFVDARTNTLIVTDLEQRITNVNELVSVLDRPQPQVEIEARIVQTNRTFARALGVNWGFNGLVDPALGNTTNLAFPNSGSLEGRVGLGSASNSTLNLALGSVNGAFNLDVALTALERQGNVRLLSTPKVSTLNNVEAEVAQGVQVPYQTVSNNTVTTQFRDAALVLKVTPQITAAGTVIMRISVDKGSVGATFGGVPSINTQRANTTVLVSDGETTVIGGIYDSRSTQSTDSTPGLGRVPFLKWLFNREDVSDENTELLIFITPRIIRS
jgi:type IV pilus assembly protein PilQ